MMGTNYEMLRQSHDTTMVNYKSSKQSNSKLPDDLAFISPMLGGMLGVAIGWIIANYVGII